MSIEAVLFDFDGTLADTLPVSFTAFRAVFQKYESRQVTNEELVAMFGPTEDGIITGNFKNREHIPQAIEEYYTLYRQGHVDTMQHDPSINKLLQLLKERGKKIAVITGKSRAAFKISTDALGMADYFDLTITGDDTRSPKPDPEGILKALDVLGVAKENAIFLGDSNADIGAGKAAGVRTFGVHWLSTFQSPVFDAAPDRIFTKISEFHDLMEKEETRHGQ